MFARTIVKGKREGVNAFLVPIRDAVLQKFPGVVINEMGYKIGLNGVDNAALLFSEASTIEYNLIRE